MMVQKVFLLSIYIYSISEWSNNFTIKVNFLSKYQYRWHLQKLDFIDYGHMLSVIILKTVFQQTVESERKINSVECDNNKNENFLLLLIILVVILAIEIKWKNIWSQLKKRLKTWTVILLNFQKIHTKQYFFWKTVIFQTQYHISYFSKIFKIFDRIKLIKHYIFIT